MTADAFRDRSRDKWGNEWALLCLSEAVHAHWGVRIDLWFRAGSPPRFSEADNSVRAYMDMYRPWVHALRLYQERIFDHGGFPYRHFAAASYDPSEGFKWSLLVFGSGARPKRFEPVRYGYPDLDWQAGDSVLLDLDLGSIVAFCDALEVSDVTGQLAGPYPWFDHSTVPPFGCGEVVLMAERAADNGEPLESGLVRFDEVLWADGSSRTFELHGEPLDLLCASYVRAWRFPPGAPPREGWPDGDVIAAYRRRLLDGRAFRYFDEVPFVNRRTGSFE